MLDMITWYLQSLLLIPNFLLASSAHPPVMISNPFTTSSKSKHAIPCHLPRPFRTQLTSMYVQSSCLKGLVQLYYISPSRVCSSQLTAHLSETSWNPSVNYLRHRPCTEDLCLLFRPYLAEDPASSLSFLHLFCSKGESKRFRCTDGV